MAIASESKTKLQLNCGNVTLDNEKITKLNTLILYRQWWLVNSESVCKFLWRIQLSFSSLILCTSIIFSIATPSPYLYIIYNYIILYIYNYIENSKSYNGYTETITSQLCVSSHSAPSLPKHSQVLTLAIYIIIKLY